MSAAQGVELNQCMPTVKPVKTPVVCSGVKVTPKCLVAKVIKVVLMAERDRRRKELDVPERTGADQLFDQRLAHG